MNAEQDDETTMVEMIASERASAEHWRKRAAWWRQEFQSEEDARRCEEWARRDDACADALQRRLDRMRAIRPTQENP